MAKYVQPRIDFHGILESHNQLTIDASLILAGGGDKALQFTTALTTSTVDTPRALILEGATGSVRERTLGTMAWEASTNYYPRSEVDGKFLELAGGTLTGGLVLDNTGGVALDSVTITTIDTSTDGVSSLDTAIPTSGAVKSLVDSAISAGVTASNGLNEVEGDIQFGGILSKDTSIDLNTNDLAIYDQSTAIFEYDNTSTYHSLTLAANNSTDYSQSIVISAASGGEGSNEIIRLGSQTSGSIKIIAGRTYINGDARGGTYAAEYEGDYPSSSYSNRSIPDWQSVKTYADGVGAAANRGAGNGLQILTDGSYGLGSALTEATTITTTAANTLTFAGLQAQSEQTTIVSHINGVLGTTTLGGMAFKSDADYVELAGDTMTGALAITAAGTGLNVSNDATISGTLTLANLTMNSNTVNAISTSVTAASTDSELPTAKAVWDSIPTAGIGISETSNAFDLDITNTSTVAGNAVFAKIDDGVGNIRLDSDDIVDGIVTSKSITNDVSVYRNASHELKVDVAEITSDSLVSVASATAFGSGDIRIKRDTNDNTLFIEGDDIQGVANIPQHMNGLEAIGSGGDNSIGIGGDLIQNTDINTQGFVFSITGETKIHGNLTVDGSLTYINSVDLDVSDNIISVNVGETGAGVSKGYAGIRIDRGTANDYMFVFEESSDTFRIGIENESGLPGNSQAVATRENTPGSLAIPYWNATANRFDTTTDLELNANQLVLNRGLAITSSMVTMATENTALVIDTDGSVGVRELSDTAFTDAVTATGTGPINVSGADQVLSTMAISIDQANTSTDGYLSSTDWDTFNDKIDAVASTVSGATGAKNVYAEESPTGTALIKQLVPGTGVTFTSDSSTITINAADSTTTVHKYTGSFSSTGIDTITITQATHQIAQGYYNISVYEGTDLVEVGISINGSGDVTFSWVSGSLAGTINYIITG